MDHLSREARSRVMSRIRSVETGPERALRAALWSRGLRGHRKNYRVLPGISSADVAYTRWRVAVFVDGAFWHGHPQHFTPGKSGAYWDEKISRNKARDLRTSRVLRRRGWRVLRFWDFDVEGRLPVVVARVSRAIDERRDAAVSA